VQGCPRGLVVDNALALCQATKRVVHNCEAPGGQPVFEAGASALRAFGVDAVKENDRRYRPTSVPLW
jgi:hypothetical protein